MANYFLKVDKDLFKLGLNPTEILLLAQIMEFQTNTGDCFMSDRALAENFGVSDKTISRALSALESKGFITRDTRNVKGGKERHITANLNKINQGLATDKMSIDGGLQPTKCPLATDKMSFGKGQNDLIKDNIKDKEKDNNSEVELLSASLQANSTSLQVEPGEGTITNPIEVDVEWLREQYRNNPNEWLSKSACNCVLHKPSGKHYRRKD